MSHQRATGHQIPMLTGRLEIRLTVESDRSRFVELFTDETFMVFAGVCSTEQAHVRFDRMLANAADFPFAKQPVIDRSNGTILGYSGVARFELDGVPALEFGYRLHQSARGKGLATEAGAALIKLAKQTYDGVLYAMIDPTNAPSMRVIDKLGFGYWRTIDIDGYTDRLYRLDMSSSTTEQGH